MIELKVDTKKYSLPVIRYAAYLFTKDFYVELKIEKGFCKAVFEPKSKVNKTDIKKAFFKELEEEKFRSSLFDSNRKLREYLITSALKYTEKPQPPAPTEGLTPEEEKELDKIIAEVEAELKGEKEKEDPLEIKKTWEEKYGSKNKRR